MQIKTISTVAGVNEIDFGNDSSQSTAHFYWFKNLGNSTLYVSAKPNPVAGEDNVAELSVKGAASIETDEGKVYVLGSGKVEIHRTNSKFCPFELPSTGSGGGGTVDAYSKTESDAKYAQKTDIPTTLPANGGNADTVDGHHVDNLIHVSGNTPPKYITEFLRINDDTKSIERWSTDNLKVAFAKNATNAENADTVDGLHANDFLGKNYVYPAFANYGFGADLNNYVTEYHGFIYNCDNSPSAHDYGFLDVSFFDGTGFVPSTPDKGGVVLQKFSRIDNCVFTRMRYANVWSGWKEISTTPIKSELISASTDSWSHTKLFSVSENKKPFAVSFANNSYIYSIFDSDGYYYLDLYNGGTLQPIPNTPLDFRVYYY